MEPNRRRHVGSGTVLAAIWLVFGGSVWLLTTSTSLTGLPAVLGCLVIGLFLAGVLTAHRLAVVWRWTFARQVPLPNWLWIGGLAAAAVLVTLLPAWVRSPFVFASLFVSLGGGSYLLAASGRGRWLREWVAWPGWVAVGVVGLVAASVCVPLVQGWSGLDLVVFLAAVPFVFQISFLLPGGLYHSITDTASPSLKTYPLVSVVIPAYNEEGVVGDCVEAVLGSTYPSDRLEVVVVDDGSTDGTAAEIASYRDRGVTLVQRANGGKHAALNLGVCCTSGSVIVTVDADSRPRPRAITRMVRYLQANPSVGALSASVLPANDSGPLTTLQRIEYALANVNRRAFSLLAAVPLVPGCLGVYRRAALDGTYGFDPDTLTEDFDLTVQLLKNGWEVHHGPGVVETIVPDDWNSLWQQRLRWSHGSLETILKHREVLFEPRHRHLHTVSMPSMAASFFSPVGSFAIVGAVGYQLVVDPSVAILALCGSFLVLTVLIAAVPLLLGRESLGHLLYAPLLFVGYKQFLDLTVGVGTLRALIGRRQW